MFIDLLLNLIFPNVCGICNIKINKKYTCEKCFNILKYTIEQELCVRKIDSNVDVLISLFQYKGFIRKKILAFKFGNKTYVGKMFADLMSDIFRRYNYKIDLVIPVPIHKSRYKERGYNQSEILAKYISKRLKYKFDSKKLFKCKNTVPQSNLQLMDRKNNIINAFDVRNKQMLIGKNVLLIDDVYTTGATVNECAKVLKKSGVNTVICLTIAYAR